MRRKKNFFPENILLVILLVFVVGICIYQGVTEEQPVTGGNPDLEVLTLEDTFQNMGQAPEIYYASDAEELSCGNPWVEPEDREETEEEIRFPVFKKKPQMEIYPDETQLEKEGLQQGEKIPESIMRKFTADISEESGRQALAAYLQAKYASFMQADYDNAAFYGLGYAPGRGCSLYKAVFYRGKEEEQENLLEFCLNKTVVVFTELGEIDFIYQNSLTELEEIGKYPVIREEQAKQLLNEGRYFTNVPGDYPGEEAVVRGEVVYRNDGSDILIPYYRFLLRLPEEPEMAGRSAYGAFYVPAVKGEYLNNISIWHEVEESDNPQQSKPPL